jgi:hypothetical protein
VYYVKVVTRGASTRVKGSPRQAIDYITDGHDLRRDPGYSDGELAYIARMGDGWKTDLEGGRVPLVGVGALRGETDERAMAKEFERACLPNGRRSTHGYRSFTFTVPKEVSLFAEGHRDDAKRAMYAAVQKALDGIYGDKIYTSVAAIHTRNENGEIHYHAHVLVGKFAQDRATGKTYSLNSAAGGNTGHLQLAQLKAFWKEALDKELKERLGLTVEQRTPNAAPALVLPDGTRLDALSRASRRLLEKDVAPWYAVPDKSGALVQRQLRFGAMDDRIFEVAAGDHGASGWRLEIFKKLFPEHERFAARYEKRVGTLKAIGYLTPGGQLTAEFRLHFALHHGINTPEVQRLRLDLAEHGATENTASRKPDRNASFQERIAHLGLSSDDLRKLNRDAEARKPTPETLRRIRLDAARVALTRPTPPLPQTKTVIRAYVDLQKSRLQRVYVLAAGVAALRYGEHKKIAEKLRRTAERDLFYAKERRLARLATGLRPIFGIVRVALPKQALKLEKAVERCARLGYSQEIRRIEREQVRKAYLDWRKSFVERPLAAARTMYEKGYVALCALHRAEATTLRQWAGREQELVAAVYEAARSPERQSKDLPEDQYQAAVRAGQIGRLLLREAEAPTLRLRSEQPEAADLRRLAGRLHAFDIAAPLSQQNLATLAPVELKKSLAAFKGAGLLDEGPGWTLKAGAAQSLTRDLTRTVDRALDADRLLTDALLRRRYPQ